MIKVVVLLVISHNDGLVGGGSVIGSVNDGYVQ